MERVKPGHEYAVEHLNVPLIVILGHSRCGAVTAVVDRCEAHGRIKSIACRIAVTVEETEQVEPNLNHTEFIDACSRCQCPKSRGAPQIGKRHNS